MKKVWLILDGRAWDDPDNAAVYEAFSSDEGDTLESVKATRKKEWADGVIYEYDSVRKPDGTDWMENQKLIG